VRVRLHPKPETSTPRVPPNTSADLRTVRSTEFGRRGAEPTDLLDAATLGYEHLLNFQDHRRKEMINFPPSSGCGAAR
jgi:hypothetical protein